MGVNSLPKTVTWQHRDCNLNPGPSSPESSTLTTQCVLMYIAQQRRMATVCDINLCCTLYLINISGSASTPSATIVPNMLSVLHFTNAADAIIEAMLCRWRHCSCDVSITSVQDVTCAFNSSLDNVYKVTVLLPSVLWCCWLGSRKGIWPVKNWVVGCWHGYLSGVRCRLAYGPADATATHCFLLQQNPDSFYLSGTGSPG